MSKLKRCPCCGGEAALCNYYFVQCKKCGLSTLTFITKEEAIKAWNTRKPMERIEERLKEEMQLLAYGFCEEYFLGISKGVMKAIEIVKEEVDLDV